MNIRVNPLFSQSPLPLSSDMRTDEPTEDQEHKAPKKPGRLARIFRGGNIDDLGRLPRYTIAALLALGALWAPVILYLTSAPLRFTSEVTLILPGAGASSSVNLSEIGQASSSASSPYSSPAVSPTVTYKRLLGANRVLDGASERTGTPRSELGAPRIKLVDETSLIQLSITGATPKEAQARATAILASFTAELDRLRADEIRHRADSARAPIAEYERSVEVIRKKISALQTKSGLVSVKHYNQMVDDLAELETHLRNTEARLEQTRDEVAGLEQALSVGPKSAGLTLKLHADAEFQQLADAMAAASAALAEVRGKYGERHPEVVAARKALSGARSRLYGRATAVTGLNSKQLDERVDMSPTGERGRLLAELVRASAKRDGFEAEHAVLMVGLMERREEMNRLMPVASRLDDLNRDYQVAEAVFTSALARTDTKKANIYGSYPLVQVLEDASLPSEPSSPRRKLAIVAGIAASVFLFIAFLLAWMRRPLIGRLIGPGQSE